MQQNLDSSESCNRAAAARSPRGRKPRQPSPWRDERCAFHSLPALLERFIQNVVCSFHLYHCCKIERFVYTTRDRLVSRHLHWLARDQILSDKCAFTRCRLNFRRAVSAHILILVHQPGPRKNLPHLIPHYSIGNLLEVIEKHYTYLSLNATE